MLDKCEQLHKIFNGLKRFSFPFDEDQIPSNGIYVLFEKGEYAHSGDRIVRFGINTGNDNLSSRLNEHFINENKDRSIFRKNIGRALLNKTNNPFLTQWEWDLTKRVAREKYSNLVDFEKQKVIENKVSNYIKDNITFVVFQVNSKEKRKYFESKLIASISLCDKCKQSNNWLGNFSPKEKIRQSGLWNVQHVFDKKLLLTDDDIKELNSFIYK